MSPMQRDILQYIWNNPGCTDEEVMEENYILSKVNFRCHIFKIRKLIRPWNVTIHDYCRTTHHINAGMALPNCRLVIARIQSPSEYLAEMTELTWRDRIETMMRENNGSATCLRL